VGGDLGMRYANIILLRLKIGVMEIEIESSIYKYIPWSKSDMA